MSALVLRLKEQPPQRCDLSPLTPDRLAEGPSMIERLEIHTTRRRLCIGDIFDVSPGDAMDVVLEGGSERFDNLGAGMTRGRIRVTGNLGQQAARGMSGGELAVSGSVGRLAGSGMTGGRLAIGGDAGDLVGAPLPGESSGMKGGVIHIKGSAGTRGGDRMRRGLIVVEGDAGEHLASRMIGGTIVCFGTAGALPGYLLNRGTVVIGGGAAAIAPTFVDTGVQELVVMRLIERWLSQAGIDAGPIPPRLKRWMGDTAVLGKGEIFVPDAAGA